MKKQIKEPALKPWIWIIMGLLVVFNAPWYFPEGSIEPIIFGLPYWGLISIILSLLLCAYLSWLCTTQWNIIEDEEEEKDQKRPAVICQVQNHSK
ncbi:hypothetical protein EPH95_12640 [Salicibibacter halophilus]|uniref:DUF3311 domain-containing protein n=1 Tax=Salicibibacter halophilus TaxID=2502791 RepID=A0A514LJ77_9BACI|nr:hypothetical protein [Salicibibacter halophilus]QDI91919.1 hypothetical protein EPH95_12640 [Salicibibacter halophilus]